MTLRGGPDYDVPAYAAAAAVVDTGELGNRLLRISPLDGKGRVIFYDDFSQGLSGWISSFNGSQLPPRIATQFSAPDTSIIYANVPPNFCLFPGSGTTTNYGLLQRNQSIGAASRLGYETHLFKDDIAQFVSYFFYDDGVTEWDAGLRFSPVNQHLQLLTTAGAWSEVGSGVLCPTFSWVPIKFTFSVLTGNYINLLVGGNIYDASNIPLFTAGSGSKGRIRISHYSYGASGFNGNALGLMIATRDEP